MTFLQTYYFLLLIIPFVFLILFFILKNKWNKSQITWDLFKIFKKNTKIKYVNIFLITIILSVFTMLLANPSSINTSQIEKKNGIDIEILFDISYSMKAEDLSPNRLEIAKDTLVNFISQISSDRVGLTIFAGKPFTSVPLTFDYNFLKDYIKNIDVDTINQAYTYLQGTAMWDALLMWINAFDKNNNREKVIILITDWEANKWIPPLQAVKLARDKNIKVYTIWIWWEKDSFVYLVDNIWRKTKVEIWWVDEKTLKSIAGITNASYFRATDNESLKNIFKELWKLNKTDIEIKKQVQYAPNYEIFEYILIWLILVFLWFNFFYFSRD